MSKIPDYIKFIYIMTLKHNKTIKELLRRDSLSWQTAVDVIGSSVERSIELEILVHKFIRKYMVLQ